MSNLEMINTLVPSGIYKEALNENPSNIKAQYQLAECYRLIQDYESAEYHYEAIGSKQDARYPLAGFYYATMQKTKKDDTINPYPTSSPSESFL